MGLDGKIALVGEKRVACSSESLVLIGQQSRVDFLIVDPSDRVAAAPSWIGKFLRALCPCWKQPYRDCFICAMPPLIDCCELLVARGGQQKH